MQIRVLLIGFLCASLLALHITAPQRYIAYIPAMEGPIKVRPAVSCDDRCAMEKTLITIREKKGHCPTVDERQPCF